MQKQIITITICSLLGILNNTNADQVHIMAHFYSGVRWPQPTPSLEVSSLNEPYVVFNTLSIDNTAVEAEITSMQVEDVLNEYDAEVWLPPYGELTSNNQTYVVPVYGYLIMDSEDDWQGLITDLESLSETGIVTRFETDVTPCVISDPYYRDDDPYGNQNDQDYTKHQWYLQNSTYDQAYIQSNTISYTDAWNRYYSEYGEDWEDRGKFSGIQVGVFDSGVQSDHPDFPEGYVHTHKGYNDSNPDLYGWANHGMRVGGLIGAGITNQLGIVGLGANPYIKSRRIDTEAWDELDLLACASP